MISFFSFADSLPILVVISAGISGVLLTIVIIVMMMTCKNLSKSSLKGTQNKNYEARCSDDYSEILQSNTEADTPARPSKPDIVNSHPSTLSYKDNPHCREFKSEHNLVNHLEYSNYFNTFTQITVPVCTSSVKSMADYCTASPQFRNIDNTFDNEGFRSINRHKKNYINESSPGTHV